MKTTLLDILKWSMATVIMLLIIWYSVIYALQGFEYYLFFTTKLSTLVYLVAWGIALAIFLPLFTFLTALVASQVMMIVRQKLAFGNVFGGIYFIGIIAILVSFWAGWIKFGWEQVLHTHPTLDKWAFSFFWLGMFGIPKKMSDIYLEYMRQKHGPSFF